MFFFVLREPLENTPKLIIFFMFPIIKIIYFIPGMLGTLLLGARHPT